MNRLRVVFCLYLEPSLGQHHNSILLFIFFFFSFWWWWISLWVLCRRPLNCSNFIERFYRKVNKNTFDVLSGECDGLCGTSLQIDQFQLEFSKRCEVRRFNGQFRTLFRLLLSIGQIWNITRFLFLWKEHHTQ